MALLVVGAAASGAGGCSALFVSGPPAGYERGYVSRSELSCTTSPVAPLIDTLVTGFEVYRTIGAVSHSEADYAHLPISRGADIALGLTFVTTFAISAGYGFSTISRCKQAMDIDQPSPAQFRPHFSSMAPPTYQPPAAAGAPPAAGGAPPAAGGAAAVAPAAPSGAAPPPAPAPPVPVVPQVVDPE